MRKSGIHLIGDVPWGTHFCQFYETKEDLIDILVPYFKAGLENNEFCMWITSEPLEAEEAKEALVQVVPDLDSYLEKGQIEIIPYNQWYTWDGVFDSDRVLDGWVKKLNNAQKRGFDGLRLTGNTFWLEKEDWNDFVDYEEKIDRVIGNYQMIAMCTYCLDKCSVSEIIDVVNNHEFALIKRGGEWTLVQNSKRKEIEDSLIESEEKFSKAFQSNSAAMIITRVSDGMIIDANESFQQLFGYTYEETVNHTTNELGIWLNPQERDAEVEQLLKQGRLPLHDVTFGNKSGEHIKSLFSVELISIKGENFILSTVMDISKLKKVEKSLLNAKSQIEQDRERLETILETSPVGIIIVEAADGEVSFINKRAQQIYGLDITGLDLKAAITQVKSRKADGSEYPIGEGPSGRALKGQTVHNEEMIIEQADGTVIPIFGSAAPIINSEGEVTAAVAIFEDISQRKKLEEAIKRQADLIELSFDAIIVWKFDGAIESWNRGAEELYGYSSNEAIGRITHELLSTVHPKPWPEIREELLNIGRWEGELQHKTKYGMKIIVFARKQLITRDDGTQVIMETNRNITQRKKAEKHLQELLEKEQQLTEELSATNEELQATTEELRTSNEELILAQSSLSKLIIKLKMSNKELEQFAYVASHDLQEPLRMVSSFAQLLERRYSGRLDEDADDYIDFIVEGAQRMKHLIDDLLAFSRLNTQVKEFEQVLMDVTLDDVLLNLKALIRENDAQITCDDLPEVIGDPSQINQLLQNLIANAIKFHGDEPPQVHITSEELEKDWLISVVDNGVGIDQSHQELIFRIFKRLHTREEYAGNGIGLAICKRIVERHGGHIWVESEPKQGSTFCFTIPK